jgi:hypothetical protein
MQKTMIALAIAAAGAFTLAAPPLASAQVARPGLAALAQAAPSDVTEVRHRGRRHHGGGIGPWGGFALGFGAGALAGSALAAPYGYYGYGYPYYGYGYAPYAYGGAYAASPSGSAHAYCSQRFRSYDPASGTYLGYDGRRHPCP